MRILAISGSLRASSSNTAVLRAAAHLAPADVKVCLEGGLGELPFFNFDLLGGEPEAVLAFRRRVSEAGGLLISSPEYGHGVPGLLKNALDWLFTGEEIVGKPVGLLNASAASVYAPAQLRETLTMMSAVVVEGASVVVPLPGNHFDFAAILADEKIAGVIGEAVSALVGEIRKSLPFRNP